MQFSLKNRQFRCSRILLFLGLAISVFTWGLQYKLSLYDPPAAITHRIPKAKLLSNEELPRTVEGLRFLGTKPATKVVLQGHFTALVCLLAFGILTQPAAAQWEQTSILSRHVRDPFSRLFFVRPPPLLG